MDFYVLLVSAVKVDIDILKGYNWNGRDLEEIKNLYSEEVTVSL